MENFTIAYSVAACLVTFAIFTVVLRLIQRGHRYELASKFPGPSTLPIIGNAHLFIGSTEALLDKYLQLGKMYPAPYRLWLGNFLVFVVNTPEQAKVVLNSPKAIDKYELLRFAQPWLGEGLLTAPGAKWRVHRKLIQPTFSIAILQSFVRIFSARSMIIAEEMERHLDGPEFDVSKYTTQWALHTTCETTMGLNLGGQTNDNDWYAETTHEVIGSMWKRAISPWLHPNFIFKITKLGKDQGKYIKLLHEFTDNVIRTKKKEILIQSRQPGVSDNEGDTDHLIDVSSDGEILSDEELREEVDTIMVAATDSSAIVISSVMLMLASHPEVQERVYRELWDIYGDHDNRKLQITPEDLTRMIYMERAIKETMRLLPIGAVLVRSVSDDLDIGEHTLPAGSTVGVSIMELHRNGDIWPDPMKFDPDRFLPEEIKKRHPYSYLPFSGGPRNCLGQKYAMMAMKTLLAAVLRRYVLKKDNPVPMKDIRLKLEFFLRTVDPITIRIEKRSREVVLF